MFPKKNSKNSRLSKVSKYLRKVRNSKILKSWADNPDNRQGICDNPETTSNQD